VEEPLRRWNARRRCRCEGTDAPRGLRVAQASLGLQVEGLIQEEGGNLERLLSGWRCHSTPLTRRGLLTLQRKEFLGVVFAVEGIGIGVVWLVRVRSLCRRRWAVLGDGAGTESMNVLKQDVLLHRQVGRNLGVLCCGLPFTSLALWTWLGHVLLLGIVGLLSSLDHALSHQRSQHLPLFPSTP